MAKKKTWREKLADNKGLPKIVSLKANAREHWKAETMVVPAPAEVDAIMQTVPRGRLITIDLVRAALARQHGTDIACPLTTGIFAWIAAHAAQEAAAAGTAGTTPWWRTLKAKGELNPKYPGGIAEQTRQLEAEGHRVIEKRRRYFVAEHEKALVSGRSDGSDSGEAGTKS